ncbi:hypothetical protein H4J50_13020 [Colwellia sp. 6M3]|uniref:hypothetical protein n=1 Tax=Colwellia sp. 6M3 TaxID=2759849 RepID=UPI0015F4DD28|nr:hypothetical protein [Colwellia sp. 6M3]MBA6416939.1 hypothetical protein [Colwellia sp. 6M3]
MSIYKPDGLVILKFTPANEKHYYKIFGSWRGGYLNGGAWRLSSGSEEPPVLSKCGLFWIWEQYSGSCYELTVNEEDGHTYYTGNVLSRMIDKSSPSEVLIEKVKLDTLLSV